MTFLVSMGCCFSCYVPKIPVSGCVLRAIPLNHRFEVRQFNQGKTLKSSPALGVCKHEELEANYGTTLELKEFPDQTE